MSDSRRFLNLQERQIHSINGPRALWRSPTVVGVVSAVLTNLVLMTAILALTGYVNTELVLKIESKDLEIALNFLSPLILYVICTAAFHSETDICKENLIEITGGELK